MLLKKENRFVDVHTSGIPLCHPQLTSSRGHFFEYATDGLYCSVSQAEEKTPVQWVPSGNQTWHGQENLLSRPIWFYDFPRVHIFSV
jgi:hypothetical protein